MSCAITKKNLEKKLQNESVNCYYCNKNFTKLDPILKHLDKGCEMKRNPSIPIMLKQIIAKLETIDNKL